MIHSTLSTLFRNDKIQNRFERIWKIAQQCRVFIAPTRYAAGSPAKVLKAASLGLPVIATDVLSRRPIWSKMNRYLEMIMPWNSQIH